MNNVFPPIMAHCLLANNRIKAVRDEIEAFNSICVYATLPLRALDANGAKLCNSDMDR